MKIVFKTLIYSSLFLFSGCLASRNPPVVPANEFAENIPYLWPENESLSNSALIGPKEEFLDDANLGIDNGIIATVGNHIITLKEFDFEFMQALKQYGTQIDGKQLYSNVLNYLIERFLLLDLASQKEIKVSDTEIELELEKHIQDFDGGWAGYREMLSQQKMSLEDIKKQIKDNLHLKQVDQIVYRGLVPPSPKEVFAEYQKRKQSYATSSKRDVSLIVLFVDNYDNNQKKTELAANKIALRLKNETFTNIARNLSGGAKAEQGGRQGFVSYDDLAEPISKVAFSLDVNEISPVSYMAGAYFIVKCHKIQASKTRTFKEVQNSLSQELFVEKRKKRRAQAIQTSKKTSYIKKLSPQSYLQYRQGLK